MQIKCLIKKNLIKCTTHSVNPVPFIICDYYEYKKSGNLAGYSSYNFKNNESSKASRNGRKKSDRMKIFFFNFSY